MSIAEGQEDAFDDSPTGNASRWAMEFAAARKGLEDWHSKSTKIEKRYLDERDGKQESETRWNLFTANVNTQKAMLYGKTPRVDVSRKFDDADDDVARVAGEMDERLLNEDIQKPTDGFASALRHALVDFLLTGAGMLRCRYVADFETEEVAPKLDSSGAKAADGYSQEKKAREEVETLYVHWKDALWSPARIFGEVRWWAFQAQLSRAELVRRFGEEVGRQVPLNAKRGGLGADELDGRKADPWGRANVWEVWSKEDRKVYWVVEGFHRTLEEKPDFLGLEGFWPFPEPMFANLTNSKFVPRPEFVLAQDLYDEVDTVSTRIQLLIDAVAVKGVYDTTAEGLQQLLKHGGGNRLIPVSNWAMFAEKGGIKGVVDWFPLDQVVAAIVVLREHRLELQTTIYQVTGMSDIVRGQASSSTTATEQSIKAKFASVRLQFAQDELARFASDTQRIRSEIIAKHFDAATIIERSNVMRTPDAQYAGPAVQLLKDEHSCYRIEVKPESISLTDYAAVKQERTEVIGAIAQYVQVAAPLAMSAPQLGPMLLKVMQWMVSGLKGASEIEGVMDAAIAQATAAAQAPPQPQAPPPPDPKLQTTQLKGQMDMQRAQFDHQASLQQIQAQSAADTQHQAQQTRFNIIEAQAKERAKTLAGIDAATHPPGVAG